MAETSRRTRLTPEERRAQLIALGVGSLADRPLEALTIEWLSETAGVSRALLFHYFGSRQGLHHAVVLTARDSMLHASEPRLDLPPRERLSDTVARLVDFVRAHRGTFTSLVRGAASADAEVREVVDQARTVHHERVVAVYLELGEPDTPLLRSVLRAWVSFAEELLVDAALDTSTSRDDLVALLVRSADAVVTAR